MVNGYADFILMKISQPLSINSTFIVITCSCKTILLSILLLLLSFLLLISSLLLSSSSSLLLLLLLSSIFACRVGTLPWVLGPVERYEFAAINYEKVYFVFQPNTSILYILIFSLLKFHLDIISIINISSSNSGSSLFF